MISQMAISKSICGNLNRRLKKRGIRTSFRREGGVAPKFEGPPVGLGKEMFMVAFGGVVGSRSAGNCRSCQARVASRQAAMG